MPPNRRQATLFDTDEPAAGSTATAAVPSCVEAPAEPNPPDLAGKSIWVIDAHSLIFQVFHALPEMTGPRGEPVNAVYGFTRDVLFLIEEKQPEYLFCAFDMPGLTFRHEMYEDYKKDRDEMPDDLRPQIESIRRVLAGLSVPVLGETGYEADDVLATVARITEEQGGECFVVTGDKDCRQLISEHVKVFNVRKNQVYDERALEADWGIRPDQVIDFQSLVGDAVDNVPGVPLIGPGTASKLLKQYESLDAVLDHAAEVGGKRGKNLIDHREVALKSRKLVELDRHMPIEINWSLGQVARFNMAPALDVFVDLGFRTFADKIREHQSKHAAPPVWTADYRLVTTADELATLAEQLVQQTCISIATVATHHWPRWADLLGLSLSWAEGEAHYIPIRAPDDEPCLEQDTVLDALRGVFENAEIEKVGQNVKADIILLRKLGIELAGPKFDALVASFLIDAGQRTHGIEELSKRYLKHETIKLADLTGTGRQQKQLDEILPVQMAHYAGERADVLFRLRPILSGLLETSKLDALYNDLELPLLDVLADMEYLGIRIDSQRLGELSEQYAQRMQQLETDIYRLAGREFNIASPKQLQQVLFEELKLPVGKRTSKSGPSTDAAVLEQLASEHELPAKILEYRQYAKLKGTYVDALPEMICPETGRVHTSFNQDGAATGRLSSNDPNLQNIPIRTETGREIRSAFRPGEEGWKLLAADYSQVELRILAHFSGDENLRAAFERDEDIHTRVASEVYGVSLDDVTSEMRRHAKAVNFGIVYGQTPFGLAKQLGIDKDEAAAFIDGYFERYPGVAEFLAKTLEQCAAVGYVSTIMGRRRAIQGVRRNVNRAARRQRNLPERTAVNTVIQGSAADLIKLAMIVTHRRLKDQRFSARMLLQIHDELVFEVPAQEVARLSDVVVEEMSGCLPLDVPLKIDVAVGDNWLM